MARTSKKTKAVTVATVADAATDAEIRNGVETADVVALLPAPEPEPGTVAEAETVADAAGGAAEAVSAPAAESETAVEAEAATVPAHGTELFIPLNKLKKSPRNARKTPHTQAEIEAYAASIAAKGVFQNLVVEPELDADGKPTGCYFVTIGEGRRLAQLLRVKRKEIKRTEPVRCVVDTENDPFEISLDENVTRAAMHPADQFEAFYELSENRGLSAVDIAARFGVSAHVVKQRLKLGAVSPKLMKVYREGGLNLDQLMAFTLTDDHARQEQVFKNLSYNKDASIIRRDITAGKVPANDRRAVFIGAEAYEKAGGTILRDLIEDHGGWFEDAALLNELVITELEKIAYFWRKEEGWKWWEASVDFPHGGVRTAYGIGDASVGSTGSGGGQAAFSAVAHAGAGLVMNRGREAAGRASESLRKSYRSGQAAAWKATGGKNEVNPGHADAAGDGASGGSSSAAPGDTAPGAGTVSDSSTMQQTPPDWAKRMKRGSTINHGVSTAAHTIRSGDHGGGSMSVNLNQDDRK